MYILKVACAVCFSVLAFFVGYGLADSRIEYAEKSVYIIETQEIIVEVEKVIETTTLVELKDFASLAELKQWLAGDYTDGLHYIFNNDGSGIYPNPDYEDCDGYAVALQKAAEESGYRISIQVDTRKHHALNCVFIGNEVYFIEPQTDEVWLECYRD